MNLGMKPLSGLRASLGFVIAPEVMRSEMERLRDEAFRALADKVQGLQFVADRTHFHVAASWKNRGSQKAKIDDTEFLAEQMRLLHGQLQILWQNFEKLMASEKDPVTANPSIAQMSKQKPPGSQGVECSDLAHAAACQMR